MSLTFAVMVLPTWVVVSQWMLLLTLGFLVLVAYRQIGFLLRLKDIATERDGLAVGEKAPAFDYAQAIGREAADGRFDPQGQWSVLLFADPGCVSCREAVAALDRMTPSLAEAQVLVVTDADPALIAAVDEFRDASVPVGRVAREVETRSYRTLSTPFAYVIDPEGIIRAKGIVGDEGALRNLVQRADRRSVIRVGSAMA